MRERDRRILEYHPQLYWKVNLQSAVEASGKAYTISPALQVALDNPDSKARQEVNELLDKAKDTAKALSRCLANDVSADGITFTDYKQARADKNWPIVDQYEAFHSHSINGKLQAEVYSIIMDIVDEFAALQRELTTSFSLEETIEAERLTLEKAIIDDIQGKGVSAKLSANALVVKATRDRIATSSKYIDELTKLLKTTLDDEFAGEVERLIGDLANTPSSVLQQLQTLHELTFTKAVEETKQLENKTIRLNSPEIKAEMRTMMHNLAQLRLETTQNVLEWAIEQDLWDEDDPLTQVVNDVVRTAEDIDQAYHDQLLDLYKMNKLDSMHKEEYLTQLANKKRSRMLYHLTDEMINDFDFEDDNRQRQVQRFIDNKKLKEPGTICYDSRTALPSYKPKAIEPIEDGFISADGELEPVVAPLQSPEHNHDDLYIKAGNDIRIGNFRIVNVPATETEVEALDIVYDPPRTKRSE